MKLKSIFLTFSYSLTVFATAINAQANKKNDLKNDLLLGKVRIVKSFAYESKDSLREPVKGKLYAINFEEYNELGYNIEKKLYNINDQKEYREINKYDAENKLIEYIGKNGCRVTFEYDSLKRCVQENEYGADEELVFRIMNKYAHDSVMQERVVFDDAGNVWGKSLYDDRGNVVDLKRFDLEGNVTLHAEYKFDERGNEIEQISKEGDFENKVVSLYNNLNQLISESQINADKKVVCKTSFEYDNYGNVIMRKSVSDNVFRNYVIHYIYKYDSCGNWIQRKEKNNVKFVGKAFMEREITYF